MKEFLMKKIEFEMFIIIIAMAIIFVLCYSAAEELVEYNLGKHFQRKLMATGIELYHEKKLTGYFVWVGACDSVHPGIKNIINNYRNQLDLDLINEWETEEYKRDIVCQKRQQR